MTASKRIFSLPRLLPASKKRPGRQLPFQARFIWGAVAFGVLGGFGLGAHMAYVLAFRSLPGASFPGMVQAHGHLQLLGWTGLFIIGVSLYKIPRLTSAPLRAEASRMIFLSVAAGLLLRSACQLALYYSEHTTLLKSAVTLGSALESTGIVVYAWIITRCLGASSPQPGAIAAAAIRPFLAISLAGWVLYALLNLFLGAAFMVEPGLLFEAGWNNIATNIYLRLVLIPVCLAFSLSTFPIFLRLRAPDWPVHRAAGLYLLGSAVELSGELLVLARLADAGLVLRAGAIFWTVFELDLLRIRRPWFRKFRENQDRDTRPPRKFSGDYGQFGNFEWLVYSAYIWLIIALSTELYSVYSNSISDSLLRHLYLLGFVTHLILGMAARIIPGFLGRSSIAFPGLVRASFVLITFSLLGRVLPQAFALLNVPLLRFAFGVSGIAAIFALLCLGINLLVTVRSNLKVRI